MMNNNTSSTKAKRVIVAVMVALLFFGMITASSNTVYAGSVCKEVHGDCQATTIFKVTTGKGWFGGWFYLKQSNKGYMHFTNWIGGEKTHKIYALYNVTVINAKTGQTKEYVWKGKNRGIWLQRNQTYYVKVNPWSLSQYVTKYWYYGTAHGWNTNKAIPKWKVTGETNITLCRL